VHSYRLRDDEIAAGEKKEWKKLDDVIFERRQNIRKREEAAKKGESAGKDAARRH